MLRTNIRPYAVFSMLSIFRVFSSGDVKTERAKYTPEDYIPGLCTHILYAFAWMNDDFTMRAYDPSDLPNDWSGIGMYARVNRLKTLDPQLQTLLSIGGWSFGTYLFKQMSQNRTRRAKFITSAIEFIRRNDFDGIDIDWEYPKGSEDILNYALLIKELRERFDEESSSSHRNRLLLTIAVSADEATIQDAYDIPKISKYVDFILLMSYDFHGAWEASTGIHNALYAAKGETARHMTSNVDWAANYWAKQGMPREKIVIGIATYGRGWTLEDFRRNGIGSPGIASKATKFIGESGVAAYYELCEMLADGAKRYWDDEMQVPYLVYKDQWFTYDDPESIKSKMEWLKRQQFGGAFVWTLDFDDFNGRCSSNNGSVYPLVGMIAQELSANGSLLGLMVSEPLSTTYAPATLRSVSTKKTQTQNLDERAICERHSDGFYPSPKSYSKFLLCLRGKSFIMDCPEGLKFHRKLLYCTNSTEETSASISQQVNDTIEATNTTTPSAAMNSQFKCTKDGYFADINDCHRFYRCAEGISYLFDCPKGAAFNSTTHLCDHLYNSQCDN